MLLSVICVGAAPVYDEYNQLNLSASCPTVACSLQNLEQPLRLLGGNSTELPQLQQLLLADSRIRMMPVELLRRTPNLRMLLMQNSSVYLMQKEDFQGVPQLQQLQMQRTHLARLREQQFAALQQLEVLELNHNMIQFVHPAAFAGLVRLQLLALRGNGIVDLPAGTFDPLVNLTHLDLGRNEISQLDAKTFAGNPKLQTLLLNDNKLLQFDSQSLLALTQLHLLDLSRAGRLEELQLYGAQRVQLEECGLRRLIITSSVISLKAANNELTELSVGDKRSPIELDLHGNQMSGNASASLLQGMWNLQHLDLSKNNIESLSSQSPSLRLLLPSLVQLNLAHNQLRSLALLPSGLIELDISFNHMLSVRSEQFAALPNLQRLYMDGMRLGQLDYRVFHTQHSMLHVLGICDQDAALMRKLAIYFKDRAVQLPVSCLHSVAKAAKEQEQEEEQEQAEPKAQAQRTDLAGICGIHPYWTLRDTLTFATLLVVMCILLMQFYNILEEEGCLRRLRDWCSGRSRRRQAGTVGNGHRNRRLNEEDSEV